VFTWLRTLFRTSNDPDPLPLLARFAQMEGDMLQVRAQLDSMHGSLRKLQGKVYRGVSLGETVEKEAPPGEPGPPPDIFEKGELYRRAAALRGRR